MFKSSLIIIIYIILYQILIYAGLSWCQHVNFISVEQNVQVSNYNNMHFKFILQLTVKINVNIKFPKYNFEIPKNIKLFIHEVIFIFFIENHEYYKY